MAGEPSEPRPAGEDVEEEDEVVRYGMEAEEVGGQVQGVSTGGMEAARAAFPRFKEHRAPLLNDTDISPVFRSFSCFSVQRGAKSLRGTE
jgi:hypothetical protein